MPGKFLTRTLTKLLGSRNHHVLKGLGEVVTAINALEKHYEDFSDEALKGETERFRNRLAQGETLDQIKPEAFAVVREVSKRKLNMRPFDVQILGGLILFNQAVAEMRTGEGKSLTSTLPAYLRALVGRGVHIVTVNEYLAQRDAQMNGILFEALGLTVGITSATQNAREKRLAYQADITYGTSTQFGFDYLRDNSVATDPASRVQRGHYYALLDEVDSTLIDEARTPMILSQASCEPDAQLYSQIYPLMKKLTTQSAMESETFVGEGDVFVDLKGHKVHLTERGMGRLEALLTLSGLIERGDELYGSKGHFIWYAVQACLNAHFLYHKDNQYIVHENEVCIIDANTGRVSAGRRWVHGIHEALEAKEGVESRPEAETSASISYQNYFRIYENMAGMTGTADTEAFEFSHIYGMETIVIPTNRPMIRQDLPARLCFTHEDKLVAIIQDIEEKLKVGRPVLVGTPSIERSEELAALLSDRKIRHKVLNARFHAQEAEIIAQAGLPSTVTIATNMAGRGTDIILGGNLREELAADEGQDDQVKQEKLAAWRERNRQVVEAGGLHVIGTEAFESRRVDNQLRGRAGRQGDPGSSRFYASFDDELFKRSFQGWLIDSLREAFRDQSQPTNPYLLNERQGDDLIQRAQRLVEGQSFESRKQVLEYDDVVNEYRLAVYQSRQWILESEDCTPGWRAAYRKVLDRWMSERVASWGGLTEGTMVALESDFERHFGFKPPLLMWMQRLPDLTLPALKVKTIAWMEQAWNQWIAQERPTHFLPLLRQICVRSLDEIWVSHLDHIEKLPNRTRLVSLAQHDPKIAHKREAFAMFQKFFEQMDALIVERVSRHLSRHLDRPLHSPFLNNATPSAETLKPEAEGERLSEVLSDAPALLEMHSIRNRLCPCGSGRRFKQCHGALPDVSRLVSDDFQPADASSPASEGE